jgi:hypothetical protein
VTTRIGFLNLTNKQLSFYNTGNEYGKFKEWVEKIQEHIESKGIKTRSEQNFKQIWVRGNRVDTEERQSPNSDISSDNSRTAGTVGKETEGERGKEQADDSERRNIEQISEEGIFRRGLEGDSGTHRLLHIDGKEIRPVNAYHSNPKIISKLTALGSSNPDESLYEIDDSETFHNAIIKSKENNKHGSSVHAYDKEEYKDMKMFISEDGMSGLAVKKDGDIVSVFRNPQTDKKLFANLFSLAIASGGKKLDCFDRTKKMKNNYRRKEIWVNM